MTMPKSPHSYCLRLDKVEAFRVLRPYTEREELMKFMDYYVHTNVLDQIKPGDWLVKMPSGMCDIYSDVSFRELFITIREEVSDYDTYT